MQRNIISRIIGWNSSADRKPLILMGARQVGKTWLMNEFSRTAYPENTVYVNLMKMRKLRNSIESGDISPEAMLEQIKIALDVEITPGRTLLILDEIQESSNALTSLKFFNEDMPELAIVAAGSLLGLAVGRSKGGGDGNETRGSFPVGKVNFLEVPPMTFSEFVRAVGRGKLAELVESGDFLRADRFRAELIELLKRYLVAGGMPEAVKAYVETGNPGRVREVQKEILTAYDTDFVKHAPPSMLPKIRLLWNSVPAQLAKENRKFIYTALKAGARAREYEAALQWLDDAGMLKQVFRVSTPRIPIRSYRDFSAFKLYAHDVGLLGAMSDLPPSAVLDGDALFTNFKGALTEQYVLQELIAAGLEPGYWSNDAGNAEVEFVIQCGGAVYPVEVKAGINTQAKSLKVYQRLFEPPFALRTSLAEGHDGDRVKDVPLFAFAHALRGIGEREAGERFQDQG